eukprot:gene207-251_t
MAVEAQAPMRHMTASHRKNVLLEMADKLKTRSDEMAAAIVVEVGKPLVDARAEVGRAIDTFTVAAEESVRQYGEVIPLDISHRNLGFSAITKRFPVGPVSMIAPFNFPLNLCAHKIAPAIAAGCPFVLKPADRTPLSAMLLGEMLSSVQLPPGAFSIAPIALKDAPTLTVDPRFGLVSFTGSPAVGWTIKEHAGRKKVVLELGGNAACIVDSSAPAAKLHLIAARILFGAFYSAGQSCISVQRVFIHDAHYDALKALLVEGVKPLNHRQGDPMNINTFLGPLISERDAMRVEDWVKSAITSGAKLLAGGQRNKNFYEDPPKGSLITCQEVFGPVCYIQRFSDFKEAVNMVNDSEFGLQAGVFTDDIHKAYYAFNNIECGGVVINDIPSVRVDSQPYGGIKGSGLGREGVRNTIEEYTELRSMIMKDIGVL